jgi:MoCo/4Fe-4S cofactor protein with predicted Tat translocation signal
MSSLNHDPNGYWKSLEELGTDPHVAGSPDEFPAEAEGDTSDPLSRRNFVQLMGASLALAGVAGPGCRRYEREEIVPLARRPEDRVPGNTQEYASVFELAGVAQPLVVTSYEGRPIKVDGNPEHPFVGGGVLPDTKRHAGTSPYAQASILHLYDPDRAQGAHRGGKESTFEDFKAWVEQARPQLLAGGVRFLSEATSSPTVQAMKRTLLGRIPGAVWHEWEPISHDNERAGTRLVFGKPYRTFAQLDKAETIVVLDGDIFVEHPAATRYSRDFAKSRAPKGGSLGDGKINRLWSIESTYSTTGAAADHRLPIRSEHVLPFAMALDALVSGGEPPSVEILKERKVAELLAVLAEELVTNKGRAVVLAGSRQPAQVHALVAKINASLDAVGKTLSYFEDPEPDRPSHVDSIAQLARDIGAGQVKALFILGGNPVYDAPADLRFGELLGKVETTVHLSEYVNETAAKVTWHVPRAHYLEAWGDARAWDGTLSIAQPLVMPLYGGLSVPELLLTVFPVFGEGIRTGHDAVRNTIEGTWAPTGWRQAVHDGFIAATAYPTATPTPGAVPPVELSATQRGGSRAKNGSLEVVFQGSSTLWDGRFANNAWLQEIPDFLTKVTWDNYALVAPATAKDLGIENNTLIKVKVGGREIEVAAYTMPGQARDSIGVILGGGRTHAGRVGGDGKKKVGFDTYKLRGTDGLQIVSGATVTTTGTPYVLASTQEHWDIRGGLDPKVGDKGIKQRLGDLIVEARTDEVAKTGYEAEKDIGFFKDEEHGRRHSLFKEKEYLGHAWGMAIDLNQCTGCNACVVACQSENNIPVVGKEQVLRNREMHWLRIDRYFKGGVDDPQIAHQPVTCQHCELAPCEQVCPVGATTHSSEGLNDMAYNRCVGTRYCLNNCPYRVRRFNFLDYNKEFKEARNRVRDLLFNPEVTVRHRGVMEKCTFCVQRIQNAKIKAKNERRELVDGEIVTACQAACSSEAIVFGDLADRNSRVSKLHEDSRAYDLLAELNTRPRNRFLARVRNPNPKLVASAPASDKGHH